MGNDCCAYRAKTSSSNGMTSINRHKSVIENNLKGKNMRMEFVRLEKYSPWHDIESKTDSEHYVNAIIEIPQGCQDKFEISTSEEWNSIRPDLKDGKVRKLMYNGKGDPNNEFDFNGMPHAYGMIPKTFEDPLHKETVTIIRIGDPSSEAVITVGGDKDPLDIFILSDRELPIGQCKCKIIGVIHFVDGEEIDYKIIAVDASFVDVDSIKELADLKKFGFEKAEAEIMNWLKYYKTVDNDGNKIKDADNKVGKIISNRPTHAAEARKVIAECRESYHTIINCAIKQVRPEYADLKWNTPRRKTE